MTSPNTNLCDQSLVELQNALDQLRSDHGIALADHLVMESSHDERAPAWAIPAEAVTETMQCPSLTRVGIMPACFKGIAATRARLVTIIDAVHMVSGQAPAPEGRGWLTLVDPGLSGSHALGLWWPSFAGISPVGAMPILDPASAPVLSHPDLIHDWRVHASDQPHQSDRVLGRINVPAMVSRIMTSPWWEGSHA